MIQKSDRRFLNSTWIALNDNQCEKEKAEIANAWSGEKPWDRYSDIDVGNGLPVFRKKFGTAAKKPVKCTVYATALGCFELFMNGKRLDRIELFERMPIHKAVILQAVPAVISQMITLVYNLADSYFVGLLNIPAEIR